MVCGAGCTRVRLVLEIVASYCVMVSLWKLGWYLYYKFQEEVHAYSTRHLDSMIVGTPREYGDEESNRLNK